MFGRDFQLQNMGFVTLFVSISETISVVFRIAKSASVIDRA